MAKQSKSRMGLLWKDYFRDPSLWYDNRSTKDSFRYPDFRQRITYESLWIHGWLNPFWVDEELRRREAHTEYSDHVTMRDDNFVALLKSCADKKDACEGIRLHGDIHKKGLLPKIPYLGSSLISMYSKCGLLAKAREVLEELPIRDVFSWNALIAGYASHGQGNEALNCFDQMLKEGLSPDQVTFVCVLKACGIIGSIEKGKEIHDEVASSGLIEKDIVLGTALVDMYAKCGLLEKAREVLDEFPVRNIISWNALITGYAQQGQNHEVLNSVDQMRSEGLSPDGVTFICLLKACGSTGAIDKGEQIHEEIVARGLLEQDAVLANALVDMYAKCAALSKAWKIIEERNIQDVVSWNALIAGYAHQGEGQNALNCFEHMRRQGLSPDAVTFTSILKACGIVGAVGKGKRIHKEIVSRGLMEKDIVLANVLVDMYAKCNLLAEAQQVLEELPIRNVISWSALIAGYVQEGKGHQALNCFERMLNEGLSPNVITFICVLKACGSIGAICKGEQIHEKILNTGLLKKDIALGNALVDMYAKCGMLVKAQEVLGDLPSRDVISWNALITGYAQHGQDHEALNCFEKMQGEGLSPDAVTFTCILKTCGSVQAIEKGKKVHEEIENSGFLERDTTLGSALVYMYARCGLLPKAREVLEQLPVRDEASWSALISGYTQQDQGHEALECFERMENEGISPNSATFVCILRACGIMGDIDKGKQIHERIVKLGLFKGDIVLGTTVVDMYAKCGMLARAQEVLEQLPNRHIVTWSVLITGYVEQGQAHEALKCFEQMQNEGHSPDQVTFICILKACASTGAVDTAEQIHEQVVRSGLIEKDIVLGTTLVDTYAKFGLLSKARQVLEELPSRNIVSWNALIAGYARHGQGSKALNTLQWMKSEGFLPNDITYLCILTACGHSGLLDEARILFADMNSSCDVIVPNIEHRTCMIMVFGYAGRFDEAISVIEAMPSLDDGAVWLALLATCRKWANVEIGRLAFDQAVQLDESCGASYVLMTDIFAASGMQEDAEKVEAMRLKYAIRNTKPYQDGKMYIDLNSHFT